MGKAQGGGSGTGETPFQAREELTTEHILERGDGAAPLLLPCLLVADPEEAVSKHQGA